MSIVIDTIVKSSKITDYLSSKNIQWSSHDGERYRYRCPLPEHSQDKTPSFFVYDKMDRQDFYCFGCKNCGSIIQLVSAYEQISIRDSIKKLSNGLNINVDDILDSLLREVILSLESTEKSDKSESILMTSLFISSHIHDFLEKVNFDKDEQSMCEKLFALVDSLVLIQNLDELEQLSNSLPSKTEIRYKIYHERIKQEEIEKFIKLRSYEN